MNTLNFIILLLLLLTLIIYFYKYKRRKKALSQNLIDRFKKDFKSIKKYNERIIERYNLELLGDPKNNIKINAGDKEYELIEKMQIHRARLIKFGESKMNNQIYYQESEGKVFIINKAGEKKII